MLRSVVDGPLPRPAGIGSHGVAGVILAAGQGSRLCPITDRLAKPLVPVLNTPLLYWAVAALRDAGVGNPVANVHTRGEQFAAAAAELRNRHAVELTLVREDTLSGPAGGLASCRAALPAEHAADACVVLSGDAMTDLDLAAIVGDHRRVGADLTIVATTVPDPRGFGVLRLRGDKVTGLDEKPARPAPDAVVSCGIYVLSRRALRLLDPATDDAYDFKHVVPMLLAAGLSVRAHRSDRYWADVGTVEAFRSTNLWALTSGAVDRVARGRALGGGTLWEQGPASLGRDVAIVGSALVGPGATVGQGVALERCVVGSGARIGPGARLAGSVIMPGAVVRAGAAVVNEVVL